MNRRELLLPGCFVFSVEQKVNSVLGDVFYDYAELAKLGMKQVFSVHYEMFFAKTNVLRGFYIQDEPLSQSCMMRCNNGAVEVTLLDLRENSATYMQHIKVELNTKSDNLIYFPSGIAYAALSREDESVLYCMADKGISVPLSMTLNAFDPQLKCKWPKGVVMSAIERAARCVGELTHNYW